MPFPAPSKIKVGSLNAATPSPFDTTALQSQLENIGLSCAQINQQNLTTYIATVTSQLQDGIIQSFAIKAPQQDLGSYNAKPVVPGMLRALTQAVTPLADAATGNWTISTTGDGYGPNLAVIQYPDHFNWLYDNRATNGFTGTIDNPPAYTGNYSNAQAIQDLFISVGTTASATLVKGLDKDAMKATLSNAIQPLANANLSDYNVTDSRTIFLVENYDPSTQVADAIGVLYVAWTLTISDYKRKSKDGGDTHPTSLTIKSGSVLYSDPATLCNDYNSVLKQFNIDPQSAPSCAC